MDEERRQAGLAMVRELYGDDRGLVPDTAPAESAPYVEATVDHLFADIWSRPGLSVRDRRLITLGIVAAMGRADVAETQLVGALIAGDLDVDQVGEVVLHVAHYAGWPNGQAMHAAARAAVARVSA
jgi:4-carboxymuconolactone decarboxylase